MSLWWKKGLLTSAEHVPKQSLMIHWLLWTPHHLIKGVAGLYVATCGVANATRFSPLATNFWRMVASLTTQISSYYFISVSFFLSWDPWRTKRLLPPFSLIRDFGKTKHSRKRFQNLCQSYALLTDQIEIHQLQALVWPSDLFYVMLAGCNWWISIRCVDNT